MSEEYKYCNCQFPDWYWLNDQPAKCSKCGLPAQPNQTPSCVCPSLTKREWFAGMALQGLIGDAKTIAAATAGCDGPLEDKLALMAISQADALIAKLNEK